MAKVRVDQPLIPGGRLEFPDGSAYRVNGGYAEVPDHKADLLTQSGYGRRASYTPRYGRAVQCGCGFRYWAFSAACPRCGSTKGESC